MSARLRIDYDAGEGALARLLGLVERRGFTIDALEMRGGAPASLRLDVRARDGTRQLATLDLQLRRLHGVHAVTHFPTPVSIASITP